MILNCGGSTRERPDGRVLRGPASPSRASRSPSPRAGSSASAWTTPAEIGGLEIKRLEQYALRFRSDVEVIVQYGRMDISQPNLAYIGMMGHAGWGMRMRGSRRTWTSVISRNRRLWNREATGAILAKIDLDAGGDHADVGAGAGAGGVPGLSQDVRRLPRGLRASARASWTTPMPTARPNIGDYGFGAYVGAEVVFGEGGAYAKPFLSDLGEVTGAPLRPRQPLDQAARRVHPILRGAGRGPVRDLHRRNRGQPRTSRRTCSVRCSSWRSTTIPRELLALFDFALRVQRPPDRDAAEAHP